MDPSRLGMPGMQNFGIPATESLHIFLHFSETSPQSLRLIYYAEDSGVSVRTRG
jgi:hypothetical protein